MPEQAEAEEAENGKPVVVEVFTQSKESPDSEIPSRPPKPLRSRLPPVSSLKMVRSAGVAPASPDWHTGILLLNDDRDGAQPRKRDCATVKWRARADQGTCSVRALCVQRTNTAAAPLGAAPAGFLGGSFGVLEAHLPGSLCGYKME